MWVVELPLFKVLEWLKPDGYRTLAALTLAVEELLVWLVT